VEGGGKRCDRATGSCEQVRGGGGGGALLGPKGEKEGEMDGEKIA